MFAKFIPWKLSLATSLLLAPIAIAQEPDESVLDAGRNDASRAAFRQSDEIEWQEASGALPKGAMVAILRGDPNRSGDIMVARYLFPPGYVIAPHIHGVDEYITVVRGEVQMGVGDRYARSSLKTIPQRGYAKLPANVAHFLVANTEVEVVRNSPTPFSFEYIDSRDDPRNAGRDVEPTRMARERYRNEGLEIFTGEEINWGPGPASLPPGSEMAIVADGDPQRAGDLLVARFKFPKGYVIPPHFHTTDHTVTVLEGEVSVGVGEDIARSEHTTLKKGGYSRMPAGLNHFLIANEDTVVERPMPGPFTVTYVRAEDDPRNRPTGVASDNPFRQTPSIARADLSCCGQSLKKAVFRNAQQASRDEFAKLLTGTWARELTWYGVVVETESALFFDFNDGNSVAMMYDQSNIGTGPFGRRLAALKKNRSEFNKTPVMTFVDCDFQIVDRYYKVDNELVFDGLAVRSETDNPLKSVWTQLNERGFFDRKFRSEIATRSSGTLYEVLTPSVGGAFWDVELSQQRVGNMTGVRLFMKGSYRGAHIGNEQVQFEGTEHAQLFKEGGAYVASSRDLGSQAVLEGGMQGGWLTDCASWFGFDQAVNWERVVIEPGVAGP